MGSHIGLFKCNMKILVTGGTGYIGSHTVVELQNAGYEVVIIDNLCNSYIEVIDRIEQITCKKPHFCKLDLCNSAALNNFFSANKNIKAVIHFASLKAVGESVEKPLMYYQNNLGALFTLLEMTLKNNIENFVFSSSCTVYGIPDFLPITEKSPLRKAASPYGKIKQISEEILNDLTSTTRIKSICLRYFNPIGAHESALMGELPLGVPNNLVPYITQTAAGKHPYLKVYGNDYDTNDGSCVRDYIHVTDIAKAHVKALERLLNNRNKNNWEAFNLGTGTGSSVFEIIKTFEKVSQKKLKYKIIARRAGDIAKIYADPSLANNELKWKTERSLEDMLASAWKWELALQEKITINE